MGIHVRKKHGRYFLDIYEAGKKRRWEALKITVSKDPTVRAEADRLADAIRIRREMQLAAVREGLLDPVAGKGSLLAHVQAEAEASQSKNMRTAALALAKYPQAAIRLDSIDAAFLDGLRRWFLKDSGFAQGTAGLYYGQIRAAIRHAVRDRLIQGDPGVGLKGIGQPESAKQPLTAEEVRKLAAYQLTTESGARLCKAFLFSCSVGLRISDLVALTWASIDRGETARLVLKTKKTGKVVSIPLNESALSFINDGTIHSREEKVFPGLRTSGTKELFEAWASRAKVDKQISWHTGRHTFATLALEGGAGLYTVQKLLGHSTSKMTETYARMTDGLLRDAVDGLPEITMKEGKR